MFQNKGKDGKDSRGGNGVTDERVDQLFQEIDRTKLGDWERQFMSDIHEFWTKNRRLSDKQRNRLAEIGKKQHETRGPKEAS